jgi:hypothetical protein
MSGLIYICILAYNLILHYLSSSYQKLFQLPAASFWHTPYALCVHVCMCVCLSTSLLSSATRCPMLILYISCLNPRISNFSKENILLPLDHSIRNQGLGPGMLITTGVCSLINFLIFRDCQACLLLLIS